MLSVCVCVCVCVSGACSIYSHAKLFQDLQRVSQTLQVSLGVALATLCPGVRNICRRAQWSPSVNLRCAHAFRPLQESSRHFANLTCSSPPRNRKVLLMFCAKVLCQAPSERKCSVLGSFTQALANSASTSRLLQTLEPHSTAKRTAAPMEVYRECVALPTEGTDRSLSVLIF